MLNRKLLKRTSFWLGELKVRLPVIKRALYLFFFFVCTTNKGYDQKEKSTALYK